MAADLAQVEGAIALLRERFTAQAHAKLQRLSEDVDQSEQSLRALVCEFDAKARDEAERVEREVAERRNARATSTAEKEITSAEAALTDVLERPPARDIGPGWRI
jgi:hypothetical protein